MRIHALGAVHYRDCVTVIPQQSRCCSLTHVSVVRDDGHSSMKPDPLTVPRHQHSSDFNHVIQVAGRTVSLIFLYYCFSIGITFYQKWFIQNFPFPLSVVLCHLIIKYLLAACVRSCRRFWSKSSRAPVSWSLSWNRTALTGVSSALDIGFSNWSFEFITVSLYTMTKTSCVIFILGFAILFGLERKRMSVVIVVSLISAGLLMFTYKSTQFRWQGFVLVLVASFLAGLRCQYPLSLCLLPCHSCFTLSFASHCQGHWHRC